MSKKMGSNSNGTQLIRPKMANNKTQTKNKVEEKMEEPKMPTKGGVRIGDNQDTDKWRCRTCKFLN